MATKNHQLPKGEVPLLSQTDTLPPSRNLKPNLMIKGFFLTLSFIMLSMVLYNHTVFHSQQLPPSISVTSLSANPLSNNITTETTWNLTLLISNPNPNYDIHFDMIMFAIFFNNSHAHLSGKMGLASVGEFVQKRNSETILSQTVVLSEELFRKNDIVKNIKVDGAKNESRPVVDVSANVLMKYGKDEKKVTMYGFWCKGLKVVFVQKPSNESVLGFVYDHLPKKLEIVFTGTIDNPQVKK